MECLFFDSVMNFIGFDAKQTHTIDKPYASNEFQSNELIIYIEMRCIWGNLAGCSICKRIHDTKNRISFECCMSRSVWFGLVCVRVCVAMVVAVIVVEKL